MNAIRFESIPKIEDGTDYVWLALAYIKVGELREYFVTAMKEMQYSLKSCSLVRSLGGLNPELKLPEPHI